MNKAADSTTKSSHNPSPFVAGTIALDMLDTAWRMTVPAVLFAVGGLLLDRKIGIAPWMTLLGLVVGFGCSALLVKKQIDTINRKEEAKERQ